MKTQFVLASLILSSVFFISEPPAVIHHFYKPAKEPGPVGTIQILIDKSDYELKIYDSLGWFATYPVVFGNNSLADKKMEGDRNTPEGIFKINSKRVHHKWHRFIGIDYPTKESWVKFKQRKEKGEIPASARIGGGIGIHGTWPHEDFQIDRYSNWTLGCISMKNEDVEELFRFISPGTKVTIRR
ncbi:MAG TPA: L,D-transpeptidase [Chitinophagaceae bacterium]|nr:L,D-transpeptidase [Chitinophagaceae bacterium]